MLAEKETPIDKARVELRDSTYHWLISHCVSHDLGDLIARMLSSRVAGMGDMPRYLGLSKAAFRQLMEHHFSGLDLQAFDCHGKELDAGRSDEHAELRQLFVSHADGLPNTTEWVADILVAGCMGGDHLWQDLGLWSRKDLTALIRTSFAPLADKNIHDMKWKKFFYKQLCIQEGVYTCRAPSCQVCTDYAACFGPQE
ncbi:MAG: nitrogen fixation protein NifQ [Pseudomonadota bacterium]